MLCRRQTNHYLFRLRMKSFIVVIFPILIVFSFLKICADQPEAKNFFLVSVPKSGTHLTVKLLEMLSHREAYWFHDLSIDSLSDTLFEQKLLQCGQTQLVYNHFVPFGPFFHHFAENHPQYAKIIQIRDLRDVIISFLHHNRDDTWKNAIEREYGMEMSFSDKLTLFLDVPKSSHALFILKNIEEAIRWKNDPDVFVMRFEDLVGSQGGGSDEVQKNC
jgi:hypothetical protein